MKFPKILVSMIEDEDFVIRNDIDENYIEFRKNSLYGQDFWFSVEADDNLNRFCDNILDSYYGFDVSYETFLWIGEDGHGKNGAPYEIIDIYEDMQVCKEYIIELYCIIDKYINVIGGNIDG